MFGMTNGIWYNQEKLQEVEAWEERFKDPNTGAEQGQVYLGKKL